MSAALSAVQAGGEVYCLTSGGYGSITISKAVSLVCDRVDAALSTNNGSAVKITAGTSDRVSVKGLHIVGFGGAGIGVEFDSGAGLTIDQCDISGFSEGVRAASPNVAIKDSRLFNNSIAVNAFYAQQTTGFVGIYVGTSTIDNNGTALSVSYSPYAAYAVFSKVQITGNSNVVNSLSGGLWNISFADSAVANNAQFASIPPNSGEGVPTIYSYGNNEFVNNGSSGATTSGYTSVGPQ